MSYPDTQTSYGHFSSVREALDHTVRLNWNSNSIALLYEGVERHGVFEWMGVVTAENNEVTVLAAFDTWADNGTLKFESSICTRMHSSLINKVVYQAEMPEPKTWNHDSVWDLLDVSETVASAGAEEAHSALKQAKYKYLADKATAGKDEGFPSPIAPPTPRHASDG